MHNIGLSPESFSLMNELDADSKMLGWARGKDCVSKGAVRERYFEQRARVLEHILKLEKRIEELEQK